MPLWLRVFKALHILNLEGGSMFSTSNFAELSKKLYLPVSFSFLLMVSLIWACKSDSSGGGCDNGTDCATLAGQTYTYMTTLGSVTTNSSIVFNDDGTATTTNTYTGSGAPANCSSSSNWTLNANALTWSTQTSSCNGDKMNFQYVYQLQINNSSSITFTSRWLYGFPLDNLWKQSGSAGLGGSYRAEQFSSPTLLILTAASDTSTQGTFQWTGDFNQSGTWTASGADFGACYLTGTAGTGFSGWSTPYSFTINTASFVYNKP